MELKREQPTLYNYHKRLLIVPYGIETLFFVEVFLIDRLLIVPYGIETHFVCKFAEDISSFNRTLWN